MSCGQPGTTSGGAGDGRVVCELLPIVLIAAVVSAALSLAGGVFGALLGILVSLIAEFLLTASLVDAVQDVRDGTVNLTVGQTVSAAVSSNGPVAVAAISTTVGPGLWRTRWWMVCRQAGSGYSWRPTRSKLNSAGG